MVRITQDPIDVAEVVNSVIDASAGGIDVFIGTTRDNSNGKQVLSLSYEAYEPMAVRMMEDIAVDVRKRWPVSKVSIVHRTGPVGIGEASVVIAVSSPH